MSEETEPYSMDELAREAGLAYATLLSFLRKHRGRIPFEMRGRARFFPPRAVEIVKDIARENATRQGRKLRRKSPEKAVSDEAMRLIDRATARLEEVEADLDSAYGLLLDNPFSVVVSLRTLALDLDFRQPVDILIEPDGPGCVARLVDVDLCASGDTRKDAIENLRSVVVETHGELLRTDPEHWTAELRKRQALVRMVRKTRPRKKAT
jgi:hypothetical protein